MKPTALITNDDGITSPGLHVLAKALSPYFNLVVVAPKIEQSGKGLGVTVYDPLHIERYTISSEFESYSVSGTPADCVKVACSLILKQKPAIVLSGINQGSNAGRTVLYSGTVGAAIEATMRGIMGLAFSCYDLESPPYENFASYIPDIVHHFMEHPLPLGTVLNVNYPSKDIPDIQGIKLAKQGMGYWTDSPIELGVNPILGHGHYLNMSWQEHEEEDPESDTALLRQGYITAVPIKVIAMTDQDHFSKHQPILDARFKIPQPLKS